MRFWGLVHVLSWVRSQILGDLTKYVPVSSDRFPSIECTATGATASLVGSAGEKVSVSVLDTKTETVTAKTVTLDTEGSGSFSVP